MLELPPARQLQLAPGPIAVRDLPGPTATAPTVVLLHGWTSTADLNWFRCYRPLSERFRVIALDHRGHGNGLRSRRRFRLADCADDAIAVLDALGVTTPVIPVGYSMGGAIAQLEWLRHRERIAGLVLAATAMRFSRSGSQRRDQAMFGGMAGLARLLPAPAMRWGSEQIFLRRKRDQWDTWAVEAAERHDWRAIVEAGVALGNFHSQPWIPDIDVPVSVVVTTDDPVVPTRRQWQLVNALRDPAVFTVDGDHLSVATVDGFSATLVAAIDSVVARLAHRSGGQA